MKKFAYLAAGIFIGALITSATPTFAATVKTISAQINNTVKLVINGKQMKLNAQPIVYNGLNYLPVGEIGRSLGLNVAYNKTSDTIKIDGSVTKISTPPPISTNDSNEEAGNQMSSDGIQVSLINQKKLIDLYTVANKYSNQGFSFIKGTDGKLKLIQYHDNDASETETLLKDVIVLIDNGKSYVELDYYESNILPYLRKGR